MCFDILVRKRLDKKNDKIYPLKITRILQDRSHENSSDNSFCVQR